ncbi:MAG: hypothetical protein ACRD3B_19625 [Candidatus Sulfotelmatobacter sp.]
MRRLVQLLPLEFRVLYRQFLLRVIDLESLSIQADIPRFLGQFASVLIFISLIGAVGVLFSNVSVATHEAYLAFAWRGEQALISGMMLVVGLVAIVSWDSTFPDRRDVMVLAPLPVAARTILFAKMAASAALLGLTLLTLNFATGVAWPSLLGSQHASIWGFFQSFAAYWFTMIAASIFVFGSVLTVQGFTALLLPRRLFLVVSAVLQIVAFGLFLAVYFLQPSITTSTAMALPETHWILAWSPSFWFFGLLNQLNGSLPDMFGWLAGRAWIGLGVVILGSSASLFLCYLRTMKKTVEEPDLVPGSRGLHWAPRFGSPLQTAIVVFSARSLTRSRHHRLASAFYLALIFSIALSCIRTDLAGTRRIPLDADFLISTFMMMSFAVFGLRSVFSLPISLTANWVWRLTQLFPAEDYIAATRKVVLCVAVVPIWLISALLSLSFRPWHQVAAHLVVLALVGWIFAELSLIGLYKVPFTCSYLPGKVHVQVVLWCFLLLVFIFAMTSAEYELPALNSPFRYVVMTSVLGVTGFGLWAFNRRRARSAVLYFEELTPDVIITLGLVSVRGSAGEVGGSAGTSGCEKLSPS